jgi:hypothetical protein
MKILIAAMFWLTLIGGFALLGKWASTLPAPPHTYPSQALPPGCSRWPQPAVSYLWNNHDQQTAKVLIPAGQLFCMYVERYGDDPLIRFTFGNRTYYAGWSRTVPAR